MRRDPRDIVWATCPRCEERVEESHLGGHEEFCTGDYWKLREALEQLEGKARLGGDCRGNSPSNFKPCQDSFYMLADIAAAALRSRAATRDSTANETGS